MPPNSLIFLVILGVWAAYLGKYWMRRREHLATARSMDRFSDSIRVLRESPAVPATDLRRAEPRSYSVRPGGTVRPQVLVKHSTPAVPEPRRVTAPSRSSRKVPRAARGLLLLAALVLFVASIPLAIFWSGRFPWWGVVVMAANVVAAFAFLRAAVQADLAARRPSRAPASSRTPSAARTPSPAPARRPAPARQSAPAVAEPVVAEDTPLYDIAEVEAPAVAASRPAPVAKDPVPVGADDDIPATWDPRPVPPPTYTMKERVDRPLPEPVAVPVPTPVELEDDLPVDFGRRASGA